MFNNNNTNNISSSSSSSIDNINIKWLIILLYLSIKLWFLIIIMPYGKMLLIIQ